MVITESTLQPYVTVARNARCVIQLDAPVAKGGSGDGFGPHELLEASIASCINMAVRMYAVAHGIQLDGVSSRVELSKPDAATVRFDYALGLEGALTQDQREALYEAARSCPVRQTLSRRIEFREIGEGRS